MDQREAHRWQLHKDGVACPIIGATKPEQIKELCEAVNIASTPEELKHLEEPCRAKEVFGNLQ